MKFRQRLAWLLLFLYIGMTCFGAYYVFEFSTYYGSWASEHIRLYHTTDNNNSEPPSSQVWTSHLADLSLNTWLLLLSVPYTAMFIFLFICTKPEPWTYTLKYVHTLLMTFRCAAASDQDKNPVLFKDSLGMLTSNGNCKECVC